MKAFVLKLIADFINKKNFIKKAFRVDENLIFMQIDNNKFFFDLTKGGSDIYIDIDYKISKKFHAPFDIVLEKKFTKAKLIKAEAKERILTITAQNSNKFKSETVKIRFEFTGRHTNAIILDADDIILESLRHISENLSSRVIKPGIKIKELPEIDIKEKIFKINDIIEYSQKLYKTKYDKKLRQKKEALLNKINKKIKETEHKIKKLKSPKELMKRHLLYQKYADVAMANLNKINPYDKTLKTFDFEGSEITIPIPDIKNINEIGNYYYSLAKKAKRKAQNMHIEKSHLLSQLDFLENYKKLIEKTGDISSLNTYKPAKKEKKESNVAEFFIDGYKIVVGKNERGNIEILKNSNANDIWLHIKNQPGAHVIIKNNKLSAPAHILQEAAKLAVAFSKKDEGEVDYTKRKFVKIKDGANVEYGKYSTIKVKL